MIAAKYVARSRFHWLMSVCIFGCISWKIYLVTAHKTLRQYLTLACHVRERVFGSSKSCMHIEIVVFEKVESSFQRIGHGIHQLTSGLRRSAGFWRRRKRVAMDKCVAGSSTLDLAQTNKIPTLEVSIAMSKLPKGRVGSSSVEHVAHCERVRNDIATG
jgi:hypothetical protein